MSSPATAPIFAYIGTFTRMPPNARGNAEGIGICRLDPATGALTPLGQEPGVHSPSYLALHPTRPLLYAVNAVPEIDGQPGGGVSAFAIDPASGDLTLLNRQSSHGAGPAYVSVDATGRWVFAANYGGGSIAILPILEDGRLGPASDVVQHEGSSVNPERQEGPHAHSIILDPGNRFALVCDLGLDMVLVYRLDPEAGRLVPNDPPGVAVAPGAGPRHLDFHPSGRFVYVINEIASTLGAYAWDAERGVLEEIETRSTLPEDFSGRNSTADIHVHPNGRFVYGSNRGHNSLAIFAIDEATGRLTYVGHESTQGETPRNFTLDPTGDFLYAANQDSDTIVTFRVDAATGRLSSTGQVAQVATPVCVKSRWRPEAG